MCVISANYCQNGQILASKHYLLYCNVDISIFILEFFLGEQFPV